MSYRENHPKCKYCKYLKLHSAPRFEYSWYTCEAKDKNISNINRGRRHCKCYITKLV